MLRIAKNISVSHRQSPHILRLLLPINPQVNALFRQHHEKRLCLCRLNGLSPLRSHPRRVEMPRQRFQKVAPKMLRKYRQQKIINIRKQKIPDNKQKSTPQQSITLFFDKPQKANNPKHPRQQLNPTHKKILANSANPRQLDNLRPLLQNNAHNLNIHKPINLRKHPKSHKIKCR